MKLSRIIGRITFYTLKKGSILFSYFNHRYYMKLYVLLLKKYGMKITGTPRYIGVHVRFDDFDKIKIGDNVTISDDCHLLTHDYSITNAFRSIGLTFEKDIAIVRGIEIGDNVFIGKKSILLPNCKIGNNCIIGAGAVVRGNIPDNSLVIGNPAQIIGTVTDLAEKWKNMDSSLLRKD